MVPHSILSWLNTRDWCKNTFEVINQLRINTTNSFHRYDVVLLLNGLPVVQVELNQLSVNPRKTLEQIVAYKADSGNGYTSSLLCFLQIFIVSNQSKTYYFANNNDRHFTFNAEERFLPVYKWDREDNSKLTLLEDFAPQFLAKCILGEMISRYMVFVQTEQKILMMRPYQIYAVRNIVRCIDQNCGSGYVWHTTGSGKTLTSFKASTLLKDIRRSRRCSSSSIAKTSIPRRAMSSIASSQTALKKTSAPKRWWRGCCRRLCRQGDRHDHPEAGHRTRCREPNQLRRTA